jgi:hypothetical protein
LKYTLHIQLAGKQAGQDVYEGCISILQIGGDDETNI